MATIRMSHLYLIAASMTVAMLILGLYPFDFFQHNNATESPNPPCIVFHRPSFALGPGLFSSGNTDPGDRITIRFTADPDRQANRSALRSVPQILAIYGRRGSTVLSVGQWKSGIVVRIYGDSGRKLQEFAAANIFHGDLTAITIESGPVGTAISANGRSIRRFGASMDLGALRTARGVILGSSPDGRDQWTGRLCGVSVHSAGKTSPESSLAIASGRSSDPQRASVEDREALQIPRQFVSAALPKLTAFELPWANHGRNWPAPMDIVINLIGFMPFGLVLGLIFMVRGIPPGRSIIYAAISAALLSGVIESAQILLPTRVSQLSDFLLNVSGTVVGTLSDLWGIRVIDPSHGDADVTQ